MGTQTKSKNYNDFVEKFKPKLTTDDCYTPPEIYEVVKNYAHTIATFNDSQIIRPFKPGGNYQAEDYTNKIVLDNPPFSKISEIIKYYQENEIKFFVFAPHLTLFNAARYATAIVANVRIKYCNGAYVNTSFITNLCDPQIKIIVTNKIFDEVNKVQKKNTQPTVTLDNNVITAARIRKVNKEVIIKEAEVLQYIRNNPTDKKKIFWGGYIVAPEAVERIKAAQINND